MTIDLTRVANGRLAVGDHVSLFQGGRIGVVAKLDGNLALVRWAIDDYSKHLRAVLIRHPR